MAEHPHAVLGLDPARAYSDDDVRAAWRRIAVATSPDRGDGGDPAAFAAAAAAYAELKTGFGVVSRAIPRWKGLPVPDLIEASVEPTFAVLDFAIKAGEPRQFAESYGKLTQACNNCHATTDHPFVVIKPPDASGWPNQDFKPGAR